MMSLLKPLNHNPGTVWILKCRFLNNFTVFFRLTLHTNAPPGVMTRLTALASVICLSVSVLFSRRYLVNIRIIKLDGFWQRILWSVRVYRYKIIFPTTVEEWRLDNEDDPPRRIQQATDAWLFLRPYFASRGYTLYDRSKVSAVLEPRPHPVVAPMNTQIYPYARTITLDSQPRIRNAYDMIFNVCVIYRTIFSVLVLNQLQKASLWGARDSLGRDVVIKCVYPLSNKLPRTGLDERI